MAEDQDIGPCESVRRLIDRHSDFWRAYHTAADEEDAFLDGERYEDDEDWHNRDRRLVQIRGRETEDAVRHLVSVWAQKPRNLQGRPMDEMGDQDSAEFMVGLIQHELTNQYKMFERELYKAVVAAHEHRAGMVWMDWHPDEGPWGEIFYGERDMRRFMWDPAYHPHHPMCSWLTLTERLHVDYAREMFKAPWLEPDRLGRPVRTGRADRPLLTQSRGMVRNYEDDNTTITQCWYKRDRSKKYRDNGKQDVLPKGERYMSCAGGCGYRSPRQSDVGQALPEMMQQGCPTCGGNLDRIDALGQQEAIYAYSKGHRLTIFSPGSPGPDDDPLYDGNWPIKRARSFPGLFLFWQVKSGTRPFGHSMVSWNWDQQVASDQLATLAVQRIFEHRDYWNLPREGLFDRNGRRFEMRDDNQNVMLRDATVQAQWGDLGVQHISGTGLDPAWQIAYGTVQSKLVERLGMADLGFSSNPEKSIDVAASTLAQVTQQENIPSTDFVKRSRQDVGMFVGVLSDYITETYTPQRLVRLNLDGTDEIMQVWGKDLPGFDFEIEDSPDFSGLEKARSDSLNLMRQVWNETQSPEMVKLYAEEMHFPPSTVRKFMDAIAAMKERADQEAQMQQQQQQEQQSMMEDQAAQDIQAGIDVPGMPPIGGMGAEANGAGMAPALNG